MKDKTLIAGKYELIGLATPGEFQYGGDGVVYDHNTLTVEKADELVEKGYPHLKLPKKP